MEEPDDKALSLFAKDGDTFVLIPECQPVAKSDGGLGVAASSELPSDGMAAPSGPGPSRQHMEVWPPSKAIPIKRQRPTEDPSYPEPSRPARHVETSMMDSLMSHRSLDSTYSGITPVLCTVVPVPYACHGLGSYSLLASAPPESRFTLLSPPHSPGFKFGLGQEVHLQEQQVHQAVLCLLGRR